MRVTIDEKEINEIRTGFLRMDYATSSNPFLLIISHIVVFPYSNSSQHKLQNNLKHFGAIIYELANRLRSWRACRESAARLQHQNHTTIRAAAAGYKYNPANKSSRSFL